MELKILNYLCWNHYTDWAFQRAHVLRTGYNCWCFFGKLSSKCSLPLLMPHLIVQTDVNILRLYYSSLSDFVLHIRHFCNAQIFSVSLLVYLLPPNISRSSCVRSSLSYCQFILFYSSIILTLWNRKNYRHHQCLYTCDEANLNFISSE
jgi:hypothetical protein